MRGTRDKQSCQRTRIRNKGLIVFVSEIAKGAVVGEAADAFLRQHSHVDLQAEQSEDGQGEQRQDDDVP